MRAAATKEAVLYARFSPRPAEKVAICESIEVQTSRLTDYCRAMGYTVLRATESGDVAYNDQEATGANDRRPGLRAALECACRRRCTLAVYSLSRLARNTKDAIDIADRLQRAGAQLVILNLNIDTNTPMGRCFFTITAAIDQLEREQSAERTKDAMLYRQANGQRMSKVPPYGWMVDEASEPNPNTKSGLPSGLVPNPAEQAIIKRIVAMRRGPCDNGLREICRALTNQGLTCRGSRWWHITVRRILEREGVE